MHFDSKNFFKLSNVKLLNETVTNGYIRKIINKENLKNPLFFKIDIEGSDLQVLKTIDLEELKIKILMHVSLELKQKFMLSITIEKQLI